VNFIPGGCKRMQHVDAIMEQNNFFPMFFLACTLPVDMLYFIKEAGRFSSGPGVVEIVNKKRYFFVVF
jgi:hypothetical protein